MHDSHAARDSVECRASQLLTLMVFCEDVGHSLLGTYQMFL